MLLDKKSKLLLLVERALNDLRKGLPIIIESDKNKIIALSPETVSKELLNSIIQEANVNLTITANRLNFINNSNTKNNSSLKIKDADKIPQLCGLEEYNNINKLNYSKTNKLEDIALEIIRIAELIPSVITSEYKDTYETDGLVTVSDQDVKEYKNSISLNLTEACRTKLTLKNNIESQIIAYRPNLGGKEHYAIIVGDIPDAPLIRIHSSCYTGDLLDSLACDCHDQLHSAIELMHENDGGIILYMLQEGRGIGLTNKLRTYTLKERGFDTVDANEALGFNDDERIFESAAKMLEMLEIKEVQLLTNNPRKSNGLEECGIKVNKCVPHIIETNHHNENYIRTKSHRLGHNIEQKS
jgi:GTP cyclohydrolase II